MANRIHSAGTYRHEEHTADVAGIYPGMLLEVDSSNQVLPHSSVGDIAEALFAEEDALQANTVDTVYTIENVVSCILPNKGSEVRALIQADQDIAIGDKLVSGGDGTLIERTATTQRVIAYAMEACDLTDSGAVNTLARVRVI